MVWNRYDFGEFLRILDNDTAAVEANDKHEEGWNGDDCGGKIQRCSITCHFFPKVLPSFALQ